jgi:hypothetical protein
VPLPRPTARASSGRADDDITAMTMTELGVPIPLLPLATLCSLTRGRRRLSRLWSHLSPEGGEGREEALLPRHAHCGVAPGYVRTGLPPRPATLRHVLQPLSEYRCILLFEGNASPSYAFVEEAACFSLPLMYYDERSLCLRFIGVIYLRVGVSQFVEVAAQNGHRCDQLGRLLS